MASLRVAAGAAASVVPVIPEAIKPTIWHFLGIPFQAGPTVACICCVLITRCIIVLQSRGRRQILLDIAITALAGIMACLFVQAQDFEIFGAAGAGVGFGVLGVGILGTAKQIIEGRFKAALTAFLTGKAGDPPPITGPLDQPVDPTIPPDMQAHLDTIDRLTANQPAPSPSRRPPAAPVRPPREPDYDPTTDYGD